MDDDQRSEQLPAPRLDFETPQHRLTVNVHPREVDFYTVSEQELEDLAAGNASVNLGIACTCLGIVVTLAVTLATVPLDPKGFAGAIGALLGGAAATFGFGAAALRDRRQAWRLIERIKSQKRQQ